ncbi:TetR/AcrR family transcriptional regulator [Acutalibacter caecimuris]|uniref:TetR/AcrR family transcriptional regulator n=1 Tax=Acutalibacter caecimuris TaxID=3093657 RepID=UPI002AC8DA4B|nr:helix-turn-helix domain-containing protein [Acutalibacter sp. M00118]
MATKEKILWEALELFSCRGYAAVSMRDIAKAVGIRESSLYNHFAGKREIFDAIVDICWEKAKEYYRSRGLPFGPDEEMKAFQRQGPALEETVLEVFRYFFEDPWNTRFRRLLALCRYEDQRAGTLYRQLYCQFPLAVQQAVFASLMETGALRPGDPAALALEFYGGVFLLLELCGDWAQALPRLQAHIRLFQAQNGDVNRKKENRV